MRCNGHAIGRQRYGRMHRPDCDHGTQAVEPPDLFNDVIDHFHVLGVHERISVSTSSRDRGGNTCIRRCRTSVCSPHTIRRLRTALSDSCRHQLQPYTLKDSSLCTLTQRSIHSDGRGYRWVEPSSAMLPGGARQGRHGVLCAMMCVDAV